MRLGTGMAPYITSLTTAPACKNVADLQEALAENAKLRELLVELYELTDLADVFGPDIIEWNSRMADIEHGMRELGVDE